MKIKTHQTLTASALAPFSSLGATVRLALKSLSVTTSIDPALKMLDAEQARIRATSRHWLLG